MIELDSTLMTFFNKTSTVFLITAILSMQWSVTHIHLAEDHQHDGASYQHAPKTHNHDLIGHVDVIDIELSNTDAVHDDSNIVELDQDLAFSHSLSIEQSAIILSTKLLISSARFKNPGIHYPFDISLYSGFLEQSNLYPRAPPHFS